MKKFLLLIIFLYFANTSVLASTDLTIIPINTKNWGDATLLESGGKYLLMDATTSKTTEIIDFLIAKNIKKFDLYLSHFHTDHYGYHNKLTTIDGTSMNFFEYIMRNSNSGTYKNYKYSIGTVYLPDPKVCENLVSNKCKNKYTVYNKIAKEKGFIIKTLSTGSEFTIGNTKAKVLYINTNSKIIGSQYVPDEAGFVNNSSLVTMFTNGKTKFLTAGDIEKYTEDKLIELGIDLSADIFKLNHHGLQREKKEISNTISFIDKIKPKYAYFQFQNKDFMTSDYGYTYGSIKKSIDNVSKYGNLYTNQVNGNISFKILNDLIIPSVEKNAYSITINYIDKDKNKIIESKKYDFSYNFYGNEIKYHLFDYEKSFKGYVLDKSEVTETTGILTENKIYNIYYKQKITNNNSNNNNNNNTNNQEKNESSENKNEPVTYTTKTITLIPTPVYISLILVMLFGVLIISYSNEENKK